MKKVFLVALLAILIGGLTGCMRQTFDYPSRTTDGRQMAESQTFYFNGLFDGTRGPVIAHQLCNGPVKSVETVNTIGNLCVTGITFTIYSPNTVRVTCAAGTAHNFYLDEDDTVVGHETVDLESGEILESNFQTDYL